MMSLMVGKGACRLRGRKWLNRGMAWHGRFLSEALWSNIFVTDYELRISILKGHKKTQSIKMRR